MICYLLWICHFYVFYITSTFSELVLLQIFFPLKFQCNVKRSLQIVIRIGPLEANERNSIATAIAWYMNPLIDISVEAEHNVILYAT